MRIAITGGTGFIGSHLAQELSNKKHRVILIARGYDTRNQNVRLLPRSQFVGIGLDQEARLLESLEKCDAVAHCAGIVREIEDEKFDLVHVQGTTAVVNAARKAGVKKIVMMSYYAARPDCGSKYHESKYAAEEIVRRSGLDYTILRAGMVYGKGDHVLENLSRVFHTLPIFALVGFAKQYASPLAVEDLTRIMEASLVEGRLSKQTLPVLGPDKLTVDECLRRVAKIVGKNPLMIPMPVFFHYGFAGLMETTMKIPLVSKAQVRMLCEGSGEEFLPCDELPEDLLPQTPFTAEQIRKGLPEPGPYRIEDLRCWQG
jgi:nucleoside-diphosphate-sugar epimerase